MVEALAVILAVALAAVLGFVVLTLAKALSRSMDEQSKQSADVIRLFASKDYHHFVPSMVMERVPERSVPQEVLQDRSERQSEYEAAQNDPHSMGPIVGEDGPLFNAGLRPNPPK